MPVYNGEIFIKAALDSLLNQTFTDFELIISDNASTDETEQICEVYARSDVRVRYVRQTVNIGAMANFQFVLNEAVGEYFIWTAADDVQDKSLLETLICALGEDERIVLATSDVLNIDAHGNGSHSNHLDSIRVEKAVANPRFNRRLFFRNPTTNVFFAIYGLYRTEVVRDIEVNFRGKVKYAAGSEIPLLAQVSLHGLIVSVPECLKKYRRHEDSLYHREIVKVGVCFRLVNMVNISQVLVDIVIRSSMTMSEKIGMFAVIGFDSVKMAFYFFLFYPIKVLVRYLLGK